MLISAVLVLIVLWEIHHASRDGFWDRWVANEPSDQVDDAVLLIKHLFHRWRCRIDLHGFYRADKEGCFHSHPAWAIRIVLWGGYEEEIWNSAVYGYDYSEDGADEHFASQRRFKTWRPGMVGIVRPELVHRIHRLLNGNGSYSLWFRGPIVAKIRTYGPGYERLSHVGEK